MKKLILLGCMLVIGMSLMAAAPVYNEWAAYGGDTLTVDSQWESTQWELLDSIIVIKTDTCTTIYTMSGYVDLGKTDRLYLGFDDGGGAGGLPIDTFMFQGGGRTYGKQTVPFMVRYIDSLRSQTDANDTIYFYAARGGSAAPMMIRNVVLTAEILDLNADGVIGE